MLASLVTTFALGLRHGIDVDHVAAITDITGSQPDARSSMRSATLYALGHGAVVVVLGSAALLFGAILPDTVDIVMERVVGATLLLLATWILIGLLRQRRDFHLQSRWALLLRLLGRHEPMVIEHDHAHDHAEGNHHGQPHDRRADDEALIERRDVAVRTSHRHRHVHKGTLPHDPFVSSTARTSVMVGLLHGIGAETGTQVLVLVAAVEAGGTVAGELILSAFVLGLMASNTAIAAVSTFGFQRVAASFPLYAAIAAVTAGFSAVTGAHYIGVL